MGVFTDLFKKADDVTEIKADMGIANASSGFIKEGGSISSTSTSISEETAMKIASIHQGINIITDTIASMPMYLYKEQDGFQQVFPLDARSKALSGMANEVLTAFNLKKNMIKDLILYGNAYAKIVREGEDVKLVYLPTSIVTPKKDSTGYFFSVASYSTDIMGEVVPAEIVDYGDMLVLIRNPKYNSITGTGLLEFASQILDMSVQETNYMTNLFKNGLSAKAVLNSKTPFKKEVKDQLKQDLKEFYSGSGNAGKMLVLEGDINVLPLSLTPADIKLIENKQFTISEIARFLNIPKHMLALDRQQGTYSNITQERLQLLQNTLTPYTVIFEEAVNQKLLQEDEVDKNCYFQFDTSQMLKLTPEDQARYMLDLYRENVVTLEEVRATLSLGGDLETIKKLDRIQDLKEAQVVNDIKGAEKDSAPSSIPKTPEEEVENEKEEIPSDK